MIKTEKLVSIKKSSKNLVTVVREHYLRNDIPCKSRRCKLCQQPTGMSMLPADTTHYVIPDCEVTKKYLEIFQLKELTGLIFLQTVKNFVQYSGGGRNLLRDLNKLIKDTTKESIFFDNEFHNACYVERKHGDNIDKWRMSIIYQFAVWYFQHLDEETPIIIITNNENAKKDYGNKTHQVFVLSMDKYITSFWPDLTDAHNLLESVNASSTVDIKVGDASCKEFQEYYPSLVLQSGIKSGRFISSYLRVNKYNPNGEAFIRTSITKNSSSVTSEHILIPGTIFRNRSIDGDLVIVELLPKEQWQRRSSSLVGSDTESATVQDSTTMMTGRVVGILQRNSRDFVVTIPDREESVKKTTEKILTVPWDVKIPKIRISTRQASKLKDSRFIVRIDSWETSSLYPNGHFVKLLGPVGDIETEISTILIEHSLVVAPFREGILKEMPIRTRDDFWEMEKEEVMRRKDLRYSHLIFSVDPQGCEDVDDTLSVRQLSNGRVELGVHIADVTHFVKTNSLTDLEARSKTTTVYLADRRYDMLPDVLSANLCSLISGVDRYAVSVIWILDANYEVVDVWYGRTVIRSKYKLFYEAAQQIADGEMKLKEAVENIPELKLIQNAEQQNKDFQEMKEAIIMLMSIARHLKAKRSDSGAIDLVSTEVQIQVGDSKEVKNILPKKPLEVHETIAECMIFANHWVAKKIKDTYKNFALLRNHPPPKQDGFESLKDCAKAKGFNVNTSSNQNLAESLDECNDRDPNFNKILRMLAIQAMMVASYFSTGSIEADKYYHYGLALDSYTHFTSPIRRYADVLVHRLLLASVNDPTAEVSTLLGNKELHELCDHINIKHSGADRAQKESVKLFQAMFFRQHVDDETCIVDALVYNLRTNGALIFIPKYSIRGAVFLRSKEGLVCTPDDGNTVKFSKGQLCKEANKIVITYDSGSIDVALFSYLKVRISVKSSKAHFDQLRFVVVSFKSDVHLQKDVTKVERNELIRNVKKKNEEKKNTAETNEEEIKKIELKKKYGQTHKSVSLYELFQSFKKTAILEKT